MLNETNVIDKKPQPVETPSGHIVDGGELFNLCFNLYTGFPLLDKRRIFVDSLVPERARFLIVGGNRYIHPEDNEPIPVELIYETLKHGTGGIFCRRIDSNRLTDQQGEVICACALGENMMGRDVASAVLFETGCDHNARHEDFCHSFLATLQSFYRDLTRSRAVRNFLNDIESYRFLIEASTFKLAAKRFPTGVAPADEDLADSIFSRLIESDLAVKDSSLFDNRIKNFSINRFNLRDFEYILISFKVIPHTEIDSSEYGNLLHEMIHKIRNKLAALQSASSQLILEKDRSVNGDNLSLLEIIHNETDYINVILERVHTFARCKKLDYSLINLNELIKNSINRMIDKYDTSTYLNFTPEDESIEVSGDAELLDIAVTELLENAADSGGRINLTLGKSDKIVLTVNNSFSGDECKTLKSSKLDLTAPLAGLRPGKAGMGLAIARKIIDLHNGQIEISLDEQSGFTVAVLIPDCQTGSN